MAYKCRAYPDPDQQVMLAHTFGCVRVCGTGPWRPATRAGRPSARPPRTGRPMRP
ncbi:MAG TPA: helix-turn-helix domain-containing protein [Actinomycetes bacterium]|nr:helix-turn-helix domain-containing protein [Actinomycetes bacterium]